MALVLRGMRMSLVIADLGAARWVYALIVRNIRMIRVVLRLRRTRAVTMSRFQLLSVLSCCQQHCRLLFRALVVPLPHRRVVKRRVPELLVLHLHREWKSLPGVVSLAQI
jgi:hypothetical protein